jgi:hypothetical protein
LAASFILSCSNKGNGTGLFPALVAGFKMGAGRFGPPEQIPTETVESRGDVKRRVRFMTSSEQAGLYRLHAAECIDLAQQSTDPESRLALLDMARSWRMLADQADKNSQTEVPVYETPEPRQRVAQQQQQPQADSQKKE